MIARALMIALALAAVPTLALSQENYEIQVYGSETIAPGRTMFELHSNYTLDGRRTVEEGLLPTQHSWHETVEITHGFNGWFETGFYTFTSVVPGQGYHWVGTHLRPRVRAPAWWNWPVGASLSVEFGYQEREFSPDTWSVEIRPIVDKQIGRLYLSFNPTLEHSLAGENAGAGFEFSPNATAGVDVTHWLNLALEYYGALGPLGAFDPANDQEHQLFGAVNLDVSPDWEINAGYGTSLTPAGDQRIIKMILGRRLGRVR